jgi:hypothetical protein
MARRSKKRYCGMCDEWVPARHLTCPRCGADTDLAAPGDDRSYEDAVDSGGPGSDCVVLERDR